MKTPYCIVQLHHKFLKYIYTLVLGKQIFIVYPLNTTGEGYLKRKINSSENGKK